MLKLKVGCWTRQKKKIQFGKLDPEFHLVMLVPVASFSKTDSIIVCSVSVTSINCECVTHILPGEAGGAASLSSRHM